MEFEFDNKWNVDINAERLNVSLFGSDKKRKKKQKSLFFPKKGNLLSAVIHDSDDEKYTKKGKKKLKNKNRKLRNKQAQVVNEEETLNSSQLDIVSDKQIGSSLSEDQNEQGKSVKNKRGKKRKRKEDNSRGMYTQVSDSNETPAASISNSHSEKFTLQGKSQLQKQTDQPNMEKMTIQKKRKREEENTVVIENVPKSAKMRKHYQYEKEMSSKESFSKNAKAFNYEAKGSCGNEIMFQESKKNKRQRKKSKSHLPESEINHSETLINSSQVIKKSTDKTNLSVKMSIGEMMSEKISERKMEQSDADKVLSEHSLVAQAVINDFTDKASLKGTVVPQKAKHVDTSESGKKRKKKENSQENTSSGGEKGARKKDKLILPMKDQKGQNPNQNKDGKLDKNVLKKMLALSEIVVSQKSRKKNKTDDQGKNHNHEGKSLKIKADVPEKQMTSGKKTFPLNSVWGHGSGLAQQARDTLSSARFRYLNEQLYTSTGREARDLFQQDREAFEVYHDGYKSQVAKWDVNPLCVIIKQIKDKSKSMVIADLGCGEGLLSQSVPHTVHSFDLVALHPHITACDMSKVPLASASVDIAIFCLSLMGTNLNDYLAEAHRILKPGGLLKIAEVVSRFSGLSPFIEGICTHGFSLLNKRDLSKMFYLMDFRKVQAVKKYAGTKPLLTLKPCIYKKR